MKPLTECHVLVTATSFGHNDPSLRAALEQAVGRVTYNPGGKPLSSGQLQELLPGVDGFIAGVDVIDRAALAAADALQVIARYGVGLDRVDLAAARERNIVVTNTPGANAASVAELAIGLMLAVARHLPANNVATKAGTWPRLPGVSLKGKVVGLLGFGAIGRQVARRLQGFECTLIAHDPFPDLDVAEALGVQLTDAAEVVARADFLSLHLPALPETRSMVDAAFLARMKPGSYLINTARGELIVERDLLAALQRGQLRGAALDAFATEPPEAGNPLLALPQVIATPHIGAHTDDAASAMGRAALRDCLAVLAGEEPRHRVV